MLQEILQGYTLYELIYCFFIYSFLGWLMETIFCSINQRSFTLRGFLIGPYCPIYGFGMCLIILLFPHSMLWQNIFLGSILVATGLEYFTSLVLETLFHTKWWDYSEHRFNFHGRVSLVISIVWGLLALFLVKLVHPTILSGVALIPMPLGPIILVGLLVLILADTAYSAVIAAKMSGRLRTRDELREQLHTFIGTLQEIDLQKSLKEKLENHTLSEQFAIFREQVQTNMAQWKEKQQEQFAALLQKWEQARYRLFERRLRNAFPHLQPKKKEDEDDSDE